MKRLIILAGVCFGINQGFCQTEIDALRYSQLNFGGTARSSAMGGAFGALGGDQSTLSVNPAGLGVFRKSEITLTPVVNASMTTSQWSGNESKDARENFHIDNFGYIGAIKIDQDKWYNINFGLVCNRTNTFSREFTVNNQNSPTSLLDVFAEQANGLHPTELDQYAHFTSNLAFEAYLIDPDTNTWNYTVPLFDNTLMSQHKKVEQRGRQTETDLSVGSNYNDRLYLGLTLGFPSIYFRETSVHSENPNPDTLDLRKFSFQENLLTDGNGFNAKFGVIGRPADFIRLGIAIHSPSWYNLEDTYQTQIKSQFGLAEEYGETSNEGSFNYKITTPAKLVASTAFIIEKKGLLSFDAEYVDYSTARLKAKGNFGETEFQEENNIISKNYKPAVNLRAGAEIRLDNISIRGGYALYGSPHKKDEAFTDGAQSNYTAGLGYRNSKYFVDFAFTINTKEEDYVVYSLSAPATVKTTTSRAILTVGVRL